MGQTSKELQTVEEFPWNIPKVQQKLLDEIDLSVWECLGDKVNDILDDNYISAQAPLAAPGNLIDVTLARKDISAK